MADLKAAEEVSESFDLMRVLFTPSHLLFLVSCVFTFWIEQNEAYMKQQYVSQEQELEIKTSKLKQLWSGYKQREQEVGVLCFDSFLNIFFSDFPRTLAFKLISYVFHC